MLVVVGLVDRFAFAVIEDFDGGVAPNTKLCSQILLHSSIDLAQFDLTLEIRGSLSVLGLEGLAVAAPRGVEFDDPDVFGVQHHLLEVRRVEDVHVAITVCRGGAAAR